MTKLNYLVKMTPLNTYFFGGERTFTTPNGETNYFARSNQWPQQTTVLGMLRYLIGKKCNFDSNKIGNHSFMANSDDGFGIIDSLSPVFLITKDYKNKDLYLLEAGTDHQWNKESGEIEKTELKKPRRTDSSNFGVYQLAYGTCLNDAPNLQFDYKDYLVPALNDYPAKSRLIDPDQLFKEQFQVGNQKKYEGGTDDEAFFKQVFYRLKEGYAFAIILTTNKQLPFEIEIDTMGADQSIFRIEAKLMDRKKTVFEKIEKVNQTITGANRIVLLSDAYLDSSVLEKCKFAICDTTDFRNIVSHAIKTEKGEKTENYHQISSKEKNPSNSAYKNNVKFNLLRRGSVLFTDRVQEVLSDLNNPIFKTIGYNYYQLTK